MVFELKIQAEEVLHTIICGATYKVSMQRDTNVLIMEMVVVPIMQCTQAFSIMCNTTLNLFTRGQDSVVVTG